MTIELFAHPFSSYCQKALIAFYENDIPFTYRMMEDRRRRRGSRVAVADQALPDPARGRARGAGGLDHHRIPAGASSGAGEADPRRPRPGRRGADAGPLLRQLRHDARRASSCSTPCAARGRPRPATASRRRARCWRPATPGWTSAWRDRTWAVGETFSLADCAAAPSLFYADWTHRDPGAVRASAGLSRAAAGAAFVRTGGGGGQAVSPLFPAGGAGSGLGS